MLAIGDLTGGRQFERLRSALSIAPSFPSRRCMPLRCLAGGCCASCTGSMHAAKRARWLCNVHRAPGVLASLLFCQSDQRLRVSAFCPVRCFRRCNFVYARVRSVSHCGASPAAAVPPCTESAHAAKLVLRLVKNHLLQVRAAWTGHARNIVAAVSIIQLSSAAFSVVQLV